MPEQTETEAEMIARLLIERDEARKALKRLQEAVATKIEQLRFALEASRE